MKLIFAQGNPGREYAQTRHNIGFLTIDRLHEKLEASDWKKSSKVNAEVAEAGIGQEKIILVKPLTFYNQTGIVARGLVDFYKLDIEQDLLVIYDDLALPFGTVRTRLRGSDAGNNGIKSLNSHLGEDYARIRIGIHSEMHDHAGDTDFVLGKLSKEERGNLSETIDDKVAPLVQSFIEGKFEATSLSAKKDIKK